MIFFAISSDNCRMLNKRKRRPGRVGIPTGGRTRSPRQLSAPIITPVSHRCRWLGGNVRRANALRRLESTLGRFVPSARQYSYSANSVGLGGIQRNLISRSNLLVTTSTSMSSMASKLVQLTQRGISLSKLRMRKAKIDAFPLLSALSFHTLTLR